MNRNRSKEKGDGGRSIRSALQDAADKAQVRRSRVHWALIVLGVALVLVGLLLVGGWTVS